MAEQLANLQKSSELINRPDLWVVGTEYDFGGGLYGQRYAGTESYSQNVIKTTVLDASLTALSGILAFGGSITYNTYQQLALPYMDNSVQFVVQSIPNTGLCLIGKTTESGKNNVPYTVWALYKK